MSYTTKKALAVIQLTANVTNDLIGSEVVTGIPTVSIEPTGVLVAGTVVYDEPTKTASADFSNGNVGESYLVQFEFITDAARKYRKCQTVKVI